MMYSEFIEKTRYAESYMTYDDYTNYIEPVYMANSDDKEKFCKKFRKLFYNRVQAAEELMLRAKTLEEKEEYICGNNDIMADVDHAGKLLKKGFLKDLKKLYK